MPGDCCDADRGAHPGIGTYLATRQACGSFDWNCSGAEERCIQNVCLELDDDTDGDGSGPVAGNGA